MIHSQPLGRPSDEEQMTPSEPEINIILMAPVGHGHKTKTFNWTANKITALIVVVLIVGGLLWYGGAKLYSQYQDENAALALEKQLISAKKSQQQERYRVAWQEQRDRALQLHQLRQKEAEEAHIAWQNYYKAQAEHKQ